MTGQEGARESPAGLATLSLSIVLRGDRTERLSCAARARHLGQEAGMTLRGASELAIIVSELVSNVARHARGGILELRVEDSVVVIVCNDRGPGIQDLDNVLLDGYSQGRHLLPDSPRGQGLGSGLGAIARLSSQFSIQSQIGIGTTVVVRKQI